MYSFGMSARDIQSHLQQVYGVEVSPKTISNITDAVMSDVREWQNRPLEKSYPILFLDALRVNSRQDGKRNINKALYVALAINREGRKEVLGLRLADTEGAKFRMSVLTDIKNRGTEDILRNETGITLQNSLTTPKIFAGQFIPPMQLNH